MAHKTRVNGTNYEISGGKTLVNGTAYSIDKGKTLVGGTAYEVGFFTPLPLNDYTWADISEIASSGQAANYWSVGDCKAIVLNGTVGTLTLSNYETYVYIIGFNHNGATNTIDFGSFKTAVSSGIDVCLTDSEYDEIYIDGTKYFNLAHWGDSALQYNGAKNYGGWKGCDARYDILGSTDKAPSGYGSVSTTSRTGYDASTTCATKPVKNTLMEALPSDLRAVMKPMTIYTNNVGNANNTASGVSASVDYLPLLAEFEVFGRSKYANSYEKNYQSQYAYYSAGKSKRKYKHNATSSSAYWRMRSPDYSNDRSFCYVYSGGSANTGVATYSLGLAPIFRV